MKLKVTTLEEYIRAVARLNECNYEYYIKSHSIVSDSEYDQLLRDTMAFEEANKELILPESPTHRIGNSVTVSKLKKVHRRHKMYSIGNVFSAEELMAFLKATGEAQMIAEFKYDGLGIELIYVDGLLQSATTRGDGLVGEDVTHTARTIKTIPLQCSEKFDGAIRGEVVVSRSTFLMAQVMGRYTSPRNMASGLMRQLDNTEALQYELIFIPYEVSFGIPAKIKNQFGVLAWLGRLGFKVPTAAIYECGQSAMDSSQRLYNLMLSERPDLPWDVDGIVLKVNDLAHQRDLGFTAKAPRGMVAWKFPTMSQPTTISVIRDQVGRTGVITPVAFFDPAVIIDGVTVAQATLFNYSEVNRLGIGLGAKVMVTRKGGVVPGIECVTAKAEFPNYPPVICPECGHGLEWREKELFCTNLVKCRGILSERLVHFVSRGCMDIRGFGEVAAHNLVYREGFTRLTQFCAKNSWHTGSVRAVLGDKVFWNVLAVMQDRWDNGWSWAKMIFALGIPNIGAKNAETLAENFEPEEFFNLFYIEDISVSAEHNYARIKNLPGFGEILADSVRDYLTDVLRWSEGQVVTKMIKPILPEKAEYKSSALDSMSFVVTGTLSKDRPAILRDILAHGGKVTPGVGKKTTFVLAGTDPGLTKINKAKALGTAIISELDYNALLKRLGGIA